MHLATLGNLLSLNIKPIGSTTGYQKSEFPKYLEGKIDQIEWLGGVTQPNLEKILQLKPDLIINLGDDKSIYPLLSKIAPTVQTGWEGPRSKIAPTVQTGWEGPRQWKEHFSFVVKVLAKEKASQKAWNHYYQRIQELKTALGDRYQNQKFSYVYVEGSNHPIFISELMSMLKVVITLYLLANLKMYLLAQYSMMLVYNAQKCKM